MTFILRARSAIAAVALPLLTILTLASCAPAPAVTSPIGVWEAVGDDNGTLTINRDGTFTMTDASFDPIWRTDSADFHGRGTWQTFSDDPPLVLRFDEATNDGFAVDPAGLQVDFTSGTIRFEDPEQTVNIEFRLAN
ncbi:MULTISPECIES: hypothetical protein [Microbacterium]|jgi:hypothetical protein|uniref:DUF5640 domain-containing protein n=2 Tax=Microbacterium TaxID=33882 RepID=A0A1H1ULC4_9MICO|nr:MULTISPECIES: hypothetical protein [Microbacterium]AVL96062.1 hypothetical protein C6C15_02460 [Microbacterium sp. str. 'China']MCK2033708.1 hypothetical protein [Microbacterium sp. KSW4-4]SDS72619.1 hypothetical protein SAMN04489809_2521 [Microbacterium paraoxydans]